MSDRRDVADFIRLIRSEFPDPGLHGWRLWHARCRVWLKTYRSSRSQRLPIKRAIRLATYTALEWYK